MSELFSSRAIFAFIDDWIGKRKDEMKVTLTDRRRVCVCVVVVDDDDDDDQYLFEKMMMTSLNC